MLTECDLAHCTCCMNSWKDSRNIEVDWPAFLILTECDQAAHVAWIVHNWHQSHLSLVRFAPIVWALSQIVNHRSWKYIFCPNFEWGVFVWYKNKLIKSVDIQDWWVRSGREWCTFIIVGSKKRWKGRACIATKWVHVCSVRSQASKQGARRVVESKVWLEWGHLSDCWVADR